jgi:hypothetical protein
MACQGVNLDRWTLQTHFNRKDACCKESKEIALPINISIDLASDIGTLCFAADKADFVGVGLWIFLRLVLSIASESRSNYLTDRWTLSHPRCKCAVPTSVCWQQLLDLNIPLHALLNRLLSIWLIRGSKSLCSIACRPALPDFMCIFPQMQRDSWIPTSIPNVTTNVAAAAPPVAQNPAPAPAQAPATVYVHAPTGYIDRAVIPIIPNFNPAVCMAQKGDIPFNKDSGTMCLHYQVIGFCVANCAGTQDHKKHTPSESTQLAAYLAKT